MSPICVNPMPTASDSAAIVMLRCEKPALAIIWKPLTMMLPNIMTVQPPSTASGSEANTRLTAGTNPASTSTAAPVAMARRFTTPVMATSPTFCEKEVTGEQPKQPDNVDTSPSAATAPESSLSVGLRRRATAVSAEQSPTVSVADTRNRSVMDRMAEGLNSGITGIRAGSDTSCMPANPEKSTLPSGMATT